MRAPRAALAVVALLLAACGGSDASGGSGDPASPTGSSTAGGQVTVLAAASLTDAFEQIAADFEAANPGTTVRLSFGASSSLAAQVERGAPADVFASASPSTMDTVTQAGLAAAPQPFARNVMEVAVPPADPAGVRELADLARPGVRVALCQPEVPCGATAAKVLDAAGLTVRPVTLESDVRATLAKVRLGEVDAAVVYATDVRAAGDAVRGVEIPDAVNASTLYPIAALRDAPNPSTAARFVDHVLSDAGQRVLADAGFRQP